MKSILTYFFIRFAAQTGSHSIISMYVTQISEKQKDSQKVAKKKAMDVPEEKRKSLAFLLKINTTDISIEKDEKLCVFI